jgi:hypothetical protein
MRVTRVFNNRVRLDRRKFGRSKARAELARAPSGAMFMLM